jgi:hypothetical protein
MNSGSGYGRDRYFVFRPSFASFRSLARFRLPITCRDAFAAHCSIPGSFGGFVDGWGELVSAGFEELFKLTSLLSVILPMGECNRASEARI